MDAGVVRTVRGDVAPGSLGRVNYHEHLFQVTPLLPGDVSGTGDVSAALFTAHLGRTGDLALALQTTTSSVFELLEATLSAGRTELLLVERQDVFVAPAARVTPRRLR